MPVPALADIVFELAIFRDASFKDPWIYVLVMAAIGIFYFAYLLVRRGRHGLTMPGMQSIDTQATAPQRVKETV